MKKAILVGAICLGWAAVAVAGVAEQVFKKASPSVMTLFITDSKGTIVGNGTAFLVRADGLAVTAHHVVADAEKAFVRFSDGKEYPVEGVIDGNEEQDIALIRIKATGRPVLNLAPSFPSIGADSFVIGAPKGLEFTISQGIVNQVRQETAGSTIQFSAPVSPGNSGSPLLDSTGAAIGVVSYQRNDGQNLNFAIPSTAVKKLNWTRKMAALPLTPPSLVHNNPVDWKAKELASCGLEIALPSAAKFVAREEDPDLKKITLDLKCFKLDTANSNVAITYFKFKSGEAPSTLDIAAAVRDEQKKVALKLDDPDVENPTLMVFKPEGADSGHAVVASFMMEEDVRVEATAVIQKGDRIWVVVVTYNADSQPGLAELRRIFDSLKILR